MKKLIIIPSVILVISIITQIFLLRIAKNSQGFSVCMVSIIFSALVLVLLIIALFREVKDEKIRKKLSP